MTRYARTVVLQLDTGRWDEAVAFADSVKEEIASFPGLVSWALTGDRETGLATSYALFESRDAFDSVNPRINRIVAAFAEFFTAPPREILGEVLVRAPDR